MRRNFARSLRKWADLIDPRVKPTADGTEMVVNISCVGVEEFTEKINGVKEQVAALGSALRDAGLSLHADIDV